MAIMWWNLFQSASVMNFSARERLYPLGEMFTSREERRAGGMACWIAWRRTEGGEVKALPFDADPLTRLTVTMLGGGQEVKCIVGGWMALIDGLGCFYLQVLAVNVFVLVWVFKKKKYWFLFYKSSSWVWWHQWCFVWLAVSLSGCCCVDYWDLIGLLRWKWMRSEVTIFSPRGKELTNARHQKLFLLPWCLMKHQPWHGRRLWRFDQLSVSLIQNRPIRFLQYQWSQVASCNALWCLTQREENSL